MSPLRRTSSRWAATVAAMACIALVGCGGSSSRPTAASTAPSAPATTEATAPQTDTGIPSPPTMQTESAPAETAGPTTTTTAAPTGGTPATTTGGSSPQACGSVAFTQASSHGAFDITAAGAGCATAQAVAGAARSCFGCQYSAQGFSCAGHEITTGLIRVDYTCTQAEQRVTFTRG